MSNTSRNSKLNCDDSYVLPTGPKGGPGSNGKTGSPGIGGRIGPVGETGRPGRSKIDINFSHYRTGSTDVDGKVANFTDNSDEWLMLGSFIYPGNTLFGGDPQYAKVLMRADTGLALPNNRWDQSVRIVQLSTHKIDAYINNNFQNGEASIPGSLISSDTVWEGTLSYKIGDGAVSVRVGQGIASLPDNECLLAVYVGQVQDLTNLEYKASYYGFELY
jgi:hypothetical protein